ncbi:hypothetical protein [Saccharopolyspora sp. 5N708]|uniref:hypothetical protein n=1 Tax=Saccharopolyspora sp. 5N708 TaxID=3457424 RepID=UPI003FD4AF7E
MPREPHVQDVSSESAVPPPPGAEPPLRVRPAPRPFYLRRKFLRLFVPTALVAVVGLVSLLLSGTATAPFERVLVLEGKMGSKEDFFNDPEVQKTLLRHHIRVHVTSMGSRDVVVSGLDTFDFVFPSGQPASDLIRAMRQTDQETRFHRSVFVSPLVLATWRDYAETLVDAGVATAQLDPGSGEPYYYRLNMAKFVQLMREGRTWNQLGIENHGTSNRNLVLAGTSDVCTSNGAGTYLGLVAFTDLGWPVANEAEARAVADRIEPLLRAQGMALRSPVQIYAAPEGRKISPVIVLYEHQYLKLQLDARNRSGSLDRDRVLLYPDTGFVTEPGFISLTPEGRRLGYLLETDPGLQRRATELGFRVVGIGRDYTSQDMVEYLGEHGVPVPPGGADTRAQLPDVRLLETMITQIGRCPPVIPR